MAEVTVSKQTVVYPAKTARKGFAHSPGIDESFGGHGLGMLLRVCVCRAGQKPPP